MRALGAAPHQVRRLIAGEALIVSLVAGVLGLLAGRPLARRDRRAPRRPRRRPERLRPGNSWIPLVAALGGAVLIAQLAVFAAARRAGPHAPGRGVARCGDRAPPPERARRSSTGVLFVGGGVAMALVFKGIVGDRVRDPRSAWCWRSASGLLGRVLLGVPAALLARPLRGSARPACSRARAWPRTGGAPRRSPRRSCSSRCSRARRRSSSRAASSDVERVTAARVTGAVRRDRPRRRADPADADPGHRGRADLDLPGRRAGRGRAVAGRRRSHARRPPALDLGFRSPATYAAIDVAVSRVFADDGRPARRRHVRRAHGRHVAPHVARRARSTSAPPASATCSSSDVPAPTAAIFTTDAGRARPRPHPRRVPRRAPRRRATTTPGRCG